MSKARGLADLGNVYDDGALSNRNLLINSAMQVSQRGDFSSAATFTSGQYWLDRWIFDTNNANSLVSQVGVDVTELSSKTKAARVEAGTTGSSYLGIRQKLEFPENYAGKTYTFSAYVRSNNVNARLTGFFIGPNQIIASDAHTGDGSWQRLSVTFTFSTTAASAAYFDGFIASTGIGPVPISAGDYMEITGVQLEVGDTATPFEHRSYSDELQRCQRYTYIISGAGYTPATSSAYARYVMFGTGPTTTKWITPFPTTMRAVPSLITNNFTSSTVQIYSYTDDASKTLSSVSLDEGSINHQQVTFTISGSGLADTITWRWNNSPAAYIGFDAEL